MAHRTTGQLALRRRIEALIRLAAPTLDLVLFVGERVSRVAGRNEIDPEPPRRLRDRPARTPLGGPPDGSGVPNGTSLMTEWPAGRGPRSIS